jgi:hypothetical protein
MEELLWAGVGARTRAALPWRNGTEKLASRFRRTYDTVMDSCCHTVGCQASPRRGARRRLWQDFRGVILSAVKTFLRKVAIAWPLAAFLLFPPLTRAATAVEAWVQRYDGPANSDDAPLSPQALAVAGGGTVVVAGTSDRVYPTSTNADYAVVKYVSPPLIVGIANAGVGTKRATFLGALGLEYVAEFATNLHSSAWFALSTNTPGTNGFWTVTDSTATNGQRFCRLRAR